MKRVFLVLLGVMLYSCSTDSMDKEQEANKEITTIDSSTGITYESPIRGTCCATGPYRFANRTNLLLKFGSFVGPARGIAHLNSFGFYNGWNMNNLPNIFPNISQPYIRFIQSTNATVVPPQSNLSHTANSPILTSGSPNLSQYFIDIKTATPVERAFLYEYGKVFFIAYDIYDGGNIVTSGFLKFNFLHPTKPTPPSTFGDWRYVGNHGPANDPVYIHTPTPINPSNPQHAYEIVIGNGTTPMPSKVSFTYAGQDYVLQAYSTPQDFRVELKEN